MGPAGRVVLFASRRPLDQLAGVPGALRDRGAAVACERLWGREAARGLHVHGRAIASAGVLGFADLSYNLHARPVRRARDLGVPTVLLVDGVVDFAGVCLNTWLGWRHLRPAPHDLVLAMGPLPAALLEAMGNRVRTTGLPRLGERPRVRAHARGEGELLVATALTPAMDGAARDRLLAALAELATQARRRSLRVRWRLTGGLDGELGVPADDGPLSDALARARAVVTTASTLAVEAMLAGVPTGVIHPHPWPLWTPAAWVWHDRAQRERRPITAPASEGLGAVREAAGRAIDALHAGRDPHAPTIGALLDRVLTPDVAGLAAQERMLDAMHTPHAAAHVADALLDAARRGPVCDVAPEAVGGVRPAARVADARPVALVIETVRTARPGAVEGAIGRALAGAGWRVVCLLVVDGVRDWEHADRALALAGPDRAVCVLEPTAGTHERLGAVLTAARAYAPAVVLADGEGYTPAVAAQLHAVDGARVVLVRGGGGGDGVRALAACAFDRWEAGLGLDGAGADGLERLGRRVGGRPVRGPTGDGSLGAWLAGVAQGPPAVAGPTDLGVRLAGPSALMPLAPGDPAAADAWVGARLAEAGYARIAAGEPGDGCDAVLVPALAARPAPDLVARWRARGLGVGVSPNLCVELAVLRAERAAAALLVGARTRLVVAGTAPWSLAFGPMASRGGGLVGWLDDAADRWTTHMGLPARRPADGPRELAADAVLIADPRLGRHAGAWRSQGLAVAGVSLAGFLSPGDQGDQGAGEVVHAELSSAAGGDGA